MHNICIKSDLPKNSQAAYTAYAFNTLIHARFFKYIEWLKLKPRYLFAILLISGILIFSPETWLLKLGLEEIVESYRGWIGGIFLISGILLLTNVLVYLSVPIQGTINDWRSLLVYSKKLITLSSAEKQILKKYIDKDTQSQQLGTMDGIAEGLVAKRILYRSSSLGTADAYFAYNIQPWAWDYLKKHPELLEKSKA